MTYEIIKTGSKGNSIVLNDTILLDIGVPYKDIKKYLKKVKIVFISHRHIDHLLKSTIKQLNYNYPKIKYICNFEIAVMIYEWGVNKHSILCLDEHRWFDLGFAKVRLEKLNHDAWNSSFQIEYKNGEKAIYICDTKEIPQTINAKNYDLYLVESNYKSREEYEEKIKIAQENGEYTYLIRVLETHLCEEDALKWLKENMGDNSQFELIHRHVDEGEDNGN